MTEFEARETKPHKPHEYFVNLLEQLPKVSLEELTSDEKDKRSEQFGNNFYLVFLAINQGKNPEGEYNSFFEKVVFEKINKYGDKWEIFLKKNSKLIEEIKEALDGLNPYHELIHYYIELLRNKEYALARELNSLGIDRAGIYIWRRLNPLLEEAAKKMEEIGINPEDFFV